MTTIVDTVAGKRPTRSRTKKAPASKALVPYEPFPRAVAGSNLLQTGPNSYRVVADGKVTDETVALPTETPAKVVVVADGTEAAFGKKGAALSTMSPEDADFYQRWMGKDGIARQPDATADDDTVPWDMTTTDWERWLADREGRDLDEEFVDEDTAVNDDDELFDAGTYHGGPNKASDTLLAQILRDETDDDAPVTAVAETRVNVKRHFVSRALVDEYGEAALRHLRDGGHSLDAMSDSDLLMHVFTGIKLHKLLFFANRGMNPPPERVVYRYPTATASTTADAKALNAAERRELNELRKLRDTEVPDLLEWKFAAEQSHCVRRCTGGHPTLYWGDCLFCGADPDSPCANPKPEAEIKRLKDDGKWGPKE